jgi:heme exporter protein B
MNNIEHTVYVNELSPVNSLRFSQAFLAVFKRDIQVAIQSPMQLLEPVFFMLLIAILFPLALGHEQQLLATLAGGIVWVCVILASLLSMERLFKDDFQDGTLEQLLLTPQPLPLLVFAKVCAHWLLMIVPILLISPLLALLLHLPLASYTILLVTLLLGTPSIIFIGAVGAALTVSLKKGGILLGLLNIPLFVPILIFATSALRAVGADAPYQSQLCFLGMILTGCMTFAPLMIGYSLKVSLS